MKRNLCFYLILLTLISCGQESSETTSAPRTTSQVGIIASCTTKAQAVELAEAEGLSFRVINEKRKLIEFMGIELSDLAKKLPRAKLKENHIYSEVLIQGDFQAQNVANDEYFGPHNPTVLRGANSESRFPHLAQINSLGLTHLGEGAVIAIIDTGVYYNHPHLSPNILTNPADAHGSSRNFFDDDGNGYDDDFVGWDFYNGDAFPIDDNGHGTHVAGLAASTLMGVAPKAKILPIKVLSASGSGDLGTITAGILYALDRGADIVNLSLGGSSTNVITQEIQELINSVKLASARNTLLVAAAGNGGNDGRGDCNDEQNVYPANIQESNVLSVASVDAFNQLTSYSNFGAGTVHVAAPGGDTRTGALQSTAIAFCNGPCSQSNTPYVGNIGTSMATPVVAGLAAVIKATRPSMDPAQIKAHILNTATSEATLSGLIQSAGVIDVARAINGL